MYILIPIYPHIRSPMSDASTFACFQPPLCNSQVYSRCGSLLRVFLGLGPCQGRGWEGHRFAMHAFVHEIAKLVQSSQGEWDLMRFNGI